MHCAPVEDPGMLVGIARQESGLEPMTLRDNASGEVLRGAGVVETARRLIAAGHSVDLGAWQINNRNLALLGPASPMRSIRANRWPPPPG
jgi:type IV secretion system protein VirB1